MSNLRHFFVFALLIKAASGEPANPIDNNQASPAIMVLDTNSSTERARFSASEVRVKGDKEASGLSCMLSVQNTPRYSNERPPACEVSVVNVYPTNTMCWAGIYGVTYSTIELFTSNGEPVAKTPMGQEIGTRTTDQQIKEMVGKRYQEWVLNRTRTDGFVPIQPGQNCSFSFSLPDLFELKSSGKYRLSIRTCVIQRGGGEKANPNLKIIRLPAVSATIELHSEENPKH